MLTCPKCGHTYEDESRSTAGKARWKGLSKKERAEVARRASMKGRTKAERVATTRAAAEVRWARVRAANLEEFLRGVGDQLKVSRPEADAQWAGFSRQLSDKERWKVEAGGYAEGLEVGKQIAAIQ